MKKVLPGLSFFCGIIIISFFLSRNSTSFAISPHVVINEIQLWGSGSTDEFIELFNNSDTDVVMINWKLTRKVTSGFENTLTDLNGTIPAHGYFLVVHRNYVAPPYADLIFTNTSYSITDNHTIVLYDNSNTIIDMVGMGTPLVSETSPAPNPPNHKSISRTNGVDTDNNASDFTILDTPNPTNSGNPVPTPTPTNTPTPTSDVSPSPTSTNTPTPTNTPTHTPTATPSPTNSPTPTNTPTNTPTSTPTPTNTPVSIPTTTQSPTPTNTLTPSPTQTPIPTPTPTGSSIHPTPTPTIITNGPITCIISYRRVQFFFFSINIPRVRCATKK